MREQVAERFHDQVLVRVNQDLAVAADQEREAHAAEVQRVDDVGQGIQAQVTANHTGGLATLVHRRNNRDHQLVGGQVYIGLGQGRAIGSLATLVPGAGTGVVAFGHFAVGADEELAFGVTQVDAEEAAGQGFLHQQVADIGHVGVQGDVLAEVFDE
ncbi:hypothetical protein D9M71_161790 [compost metagenome]